MGLHLALARGIVRVSPVCAWLVLGLIVYLSAPARTHAFCRESTGTERAGECSNSPSSILLFWGRNCMTFVFHSSAFPKGTTRESFVRKTFETSFKTWADVKCSGSKTPFLVAQASGTTSTGDAEFLYDQPNESVVLFRSEKEWESLPEHDSRALALTLIWHDKKTGEILDVDMELNDGAGTFTDCKENRCDSTSIDLQNTVTHEAGHLLGLGHSSVPGATMQPSTTKSPEIEKRDLASDDTMGYCALDLPDGPCAGSSCTCPTPPVFSSHRNVRACSCRTLGQALGARATWSAWVAGALFASVCWRRRKRRS